MRHRARPIWIAALALLALLGAATPGLAEPGTPLPGEVANVAKSMERPRHEGGPGYQAQALSRSLTNLAGAAAEQTGDPQRLFLANLCGSGVSDCQGDVRLARWAENGHGLVEEIRYTARNGGIITGHVWATRAGPPQRPVVVITPGSVQASEELYWMAAQVLAKSGYVVLTHDNQQQGGSGAFGAGPDLLAGFPAQFAPSTFFDGTQDAIDVALSTPADPYCPRPSRSGVDHCDPAAAPHNPFWELVDADAPVGLAGHSYGAFGVSYVGQQDPRVGAVVAWDNLCVPTDGPSIYTAQNGIDILLANNLPTPCPSGSQPPVPELRTPALGIAGDYLLAPTPYTAPPDPLGKSTASLAYTAAGVDTGQIVIRGGTHYEFTNGPSLPATLRGLDLVTWYTTAWFDKYLLGDPAADTRLLTDRWRADVAAGSVDPAGDGNVFSYHYRSRLDVAGSNGTRVRCEDLRAGCPALAPDGGAPYSSLELATSPDL